MDRETKISFPKGSYIGNFSGTAKTVGELLDEAGGLLDESCAGEILGNGALFKGADGEWYTIGVEAVISKAHPDLVEAGKPEEPKERKLSSPDGKDLDGKLVVLKRSSYDLGDNLFKCNGGFGCKPYCRGKAVFGHLIHGPDKGMNMRVDRSDIEAIVDE